ncbi:MAG TPA: hypothetical protein PLP53_09495, partial [Plasticicumulans sp.]|nr:hypothetical protein [Plasticicumulans sp.]
MEEQVGQLWHRLVTRAASRRHPEAAVRLAEVQKTVAVLFRALGGDQTGFGQSFEEGAHEVEVGGVVLHIEHGAAFQAVGADFQVIG